MTRINETETKMRKKRESNGIKREFIDTKKRNDEINETYCTVNQSVE